MPQMSRDTVTKRPAQRLAARAEAEGLRWLADGAHERSFVAEVVEASDEEIVTRRVPAGRPSAEAARTAGRELARLHDSGAEAFGCPPPGWDGPNYIGTAEQECTPTDDWAEFYVEQRVLPFARDAVAAGHLDRGGLEEAEEACRLVRGHDWGDPKPARIHGDLWSGNLLFGKDGPVLIDPAAHGGHRVTDLAMLALFGAPGLEEIFAGYEEVHPLPQGWREDIPAHQLHPLAVHAKTHGPAYGDALVDAARRVTARLG